MTTYITFLEVRHIPCGSSVGDYSYLRLEMFLTAVVFGSAPPALVPEPMDEPHQMDL